MSSEILKAIIEQDDLEKGCCYNQENVLEICDELCNEIKQNLKDYEKVDLILGTVTRNTNLGCIIGSVLNKPSYKFTEDEEDGSIYIKNSGVFLGKKVLIIEEFATAEAETIEKVVAAVKKCNGKVYGIAVIVDKTDGKVDFGVPFIYGMQL